MGSTKWRFLPHTQQDCFLLDLSNSIITVSGKSRALLDICGWYFSKRTSLNIKGLGWILSIEEILNVVSTEQRLVVGEMFCVIHCFRLIRLLSDY